MNEQLLQIFIQHLHQVVEMRLDDSELSVEELSRAVFLSPSQVYRKTKASTGKTPIQFIRKIRLKKALELLADSNLKIAEVAYEVGFTDPGYFTRVFKKEYGKVPGEMRRLREFN